MRVAELMATELKKIGAEATLSDAITTLADAHIYGLPVIDEGSDRMIGVLSAADVVESLAECTSSHERNKLIETTRVRDIMTPRPVTTSPEEDVREAAQQMLYLDIHRLFVLDDDDLVGVISQSDIVRAVGTAKI